MAKVKFINLKINQLKNVVMEPQTIENKIDVQNISHISRTRNGKSMMLALLLIILGVVVTVIPFLYSTGIEMLDNTIIFAGIVLGISGLLLLFIKNKQHVYSVTGSPVKIDSYYVQREQMEGLKMLLSHAGFSLAKPVPFQENGNVKIDVLKSVDGSFAAAQIFEYVPFSFQSATPLYCYTEVQANDFISFLNKCKNAN